MASARFRSISAGLAINLFQSLLAARELQLQPALSAAVRQIGVHRIDGELRQLVPAPALNHLAGLGLRGERVFPVPAIIGYAPPLIGYYRMLLGLSKKEFNRLGYGAWVTAEQDGRLSNPRAQDLEPFCRALIAPLAELVDAMGVFDDRDLSDLTLLTLGPTLQGGRNNVIGSTAARQVFQALRSVITSSPILNLTYDQETILRFQTPDGRLFEAVAAGDPDIRIHEGSGSRARPLLALEIKGGGDASNAHNRAGEAEKSHIKAKRAGYAHRWTIFRMGRVDRRGLQSDTPSSTTLLEAAEIIEQSGADWETFRQELTRLFK